jgi:glutamine synthetase
MLNQNNQINQNKKRCQLSNINILEYVWLDGYSTPNLRSKVRTAKRFEENLTIPNWNFDGSSTKQAEGNFSECVLVPARVYQWAENHFLVFCEVLNADGTPHESNFRSKLRSLNETAKEEQYWWGFEQEYFMKKNDRPLGFPPNGNPKPQGPYYCGVGSSQSKGRKLAEKHMIQCLQMGIDITGINAEVASGQWEFQCFSSDTLKACDDLWMSRYMLHRLAESYEYDIDMTPKPVAGDWNGSGCHTNFSNRKMRDEGGEEVFKEALNSLEIHHDEHISIYGEGNENRLTGKHETQHIEEFSWGVGDRGASVRVPVAVEANNWMGYLEDRRPAANCDPYKVAMRIIQTVEHIEDV